MYQININRNKYPEICEALEKAKMNNGIAWYLRKLIEKDINGDRLFEFGGNQDDYENMEKDNKKEDQEVTKKEEVKQEFQNEPIQEQKTDHKDLLPDDSGGFL
jgi:hypothetical protein